jgi:hypothetical protein
VPPDIPSRLSSLGGIKMLVAPQSIRARTHCISPFDFRPESPGVPAPLIVFLVAE